MFDQIQYEKYLKKSPFKYFFSFYGIGQRHAHKLTSLLGIKRNVTLQQYFDLLEEYQYRRKEDNHFALLVSDLPYGYDIRQKTFLRLMQLKKNHSYRGLRSAAGLPIRGGRSHTNAKTPDFIIKNKLFIDLETVREYHLGDLKPVSSKRYTKAKYKRKIGPKKKLYAGALQPKKGKGKKPKSTKSKKKIDYAQTNCIQSKK